MGYFANTTDKCADKVITYVWGLWGVCGQSEPGEGVTGRQQPQRIVIPAAVAFSWHHLRFSD